jgi:hypothetical protein
MEPQSRMNRLSIASFTLSLLAPFSLILLLLAAFLFPAYFAAPTGYHSPLLGTSAWLFYLVALGHCLFIPLSLGMSILALIRISSPNRAVKGKRLALASIGISLAYPLCLLACTVLPILALPLLQFISGAP